MKQFFKIILYQPLFNLLIFFAWLVPGHSIGWAIIILTVIMRVALLPSSIKTTHSQQKMKELAPELKKIKEAYKGDRQGEAQATMELYKKYGVSPWGSCLPLLIQLPILWILYRVFMDGLDSARFSLLYSFTPHPETLNVWFFGMNLSEPNRFVLPILAGLAQLVQSWQMKQLNPQPKPDPDKKGPGDFGQMLSNQMLFLMPIFTVFIGMKLPAALSLYWLVTTLFMVVQTWWIIKRYKEKHVKLIEEEGEVNKIEAPKKKFGVAKKIEKEEEKPAKMSLTDRIVKMRQPKPRKDVTVTIRKKNNNQLY